MLLLLSVLPILFLVPNLITCLHLLRSHSSPAIKHHGNFQWARARNSRAIYIAMVLPGDKGTRPSVSSSVDDRDVIIPLYIASLDKEITMGDVNAEPHGGSAGIKSKVTAARPVASSTVRFERVIEGKDPTSGLGKPSLLFLPGLGGKGDYTSINPLSSLMDKFDCWRMVVEPEDRSSFLALAELVTRQIAAFPNATAAALVGESFGGLLALYVASTESPAGKICIERLMVINPATSYDRTGWPVIQPILSKAGNAFPGLRTAAMLATAAQPSRLVKIGQRISERIWTRVNSTDSAAREVGALLRAASRATEQLSNAFDWRVQQWLLTGSFLMNDRFDRVSQSTLILIGGEDKILPSEEEGRRLLSILTERSQHSKVVDLVEFPDRGHSLLDNSFDLLAVMAASLTFKDMNLNEGALQNATELLSSAGGYLTSVSTRPASPRPAPATVPDIPGEPYHIPYPSKEDLAFADRFVDPLWGLTSPCFFSRDDSGKIVRGLQSVPTGVQGRPVLLVGNHQLLGVDLALLIRQFLREKEVLPRGLAHPAFFTEGSIPFNDPNSDSSIRGLLAKFGAVEVNTRSIYELMKINSTVLLFPGGIREVCHRKNEDYQLFWPEKVDFIRMAALMDAIVVPFSAIGIADSVDILLDTNEINNLPLVGQGLRRLTDRIPQARIGGNETFVPPFVVPSRKGPARNYFLFQQPFDTRSLDMYNKSECKLVYGQIKEEVRSGIDTLQRLRHQDPYGDFLPRFAYERINGRQAPTTALDQIQ